MKTICVLSLSSIFGTALWAQTVSEVRVLEETVITAAVPPIKVDGDTTEYNAASYKTQADATVEDLLRLLPGLEINADGTITANGENVTQVYVDGKEFFGNNVQVTTRNLTADMIESIQVVDMQTEEARLSGIDDGERRKVINLKLKPSMRKGWFGNVASAWGKGHNIADRWDARGTIGYFRGKSQNALVFNGNNTNNAAFGDLGDGVMSGSGMRGERQSGARGNGDNTSWSVGLNINYDEGNRMRDIFSPKAIGGNAMYGGSHQDEHSHTHRTEYRDSIVRVSDSRSYGHNLSHNGQVQFKCERSWGTMDKGMHRIQINPELAINSTQTHDANQSRTWQEKDDTEQFLSATDSRHQQEQRGFNAGLGGTYSYTRRTTHGRRRASISLNVSERRNEGDRYTQSATQRADRDTLINQWREEDSHNETYRLRVSWAEPLANRRTLEVTGSATLTDRYTEQLYHFWDEYNQQWSETIDNRTAAEYNSDTHSRNINLQGSVAYRRVSDHYNARIGLDVLPQSQSFTDYADHTRDYTRHYINYSPRLEYNYQWTRHKTLRFTLNGNTNQPSANQLLARKNQTSATHVQLGNRDLSPSYNLNFQSRFRNFNEETHASIDASINARATFNNLSSKRWYSVDLISDTTQTVNISGLGNWNVNGDFRGSFPFANNIWQVTTHTSAGYSDVQGYVNLRQSDSRINHTRTSNASQQVGLAYRHSKVQAELRANYRVQHSEATIVQGNTLGTIHNFGGSGRVTAYLPADFTLTSDFSYTARRGFSAGLTRNQSIWNAQLSRTFLKSKQLSAFVKVFDILRQRSNINRSVSDAAITDRETSVLGQYFLIGLRVKGKQAPQLGGRGGRGGGRGRR